MGKSERLIHFTLSDSQQDTLSTCNNLLVLQAILTGFSQLLSWLEAGIVLKTQLHCMQRRCFSVKLNTCLWKYSRININYHRLHCQQSTVQSGHAEIILKRTVFQYYDSNLITLFCKIIMVLRRELHEVDGLGLLQDTIPR